MPYRLFSIFSAVDVEGFVEKLKTREPGHFSYNALVLLKGSLFVDTGKGNRRIQRRAGQYNLSFLGKKTV